MKTVITSGVIHDMATDTWVPPVKRYYEPADDGGGDWRARYKELLAHHEKESVELMAVIKALAQRIDRIRAITEHGA